MPLVRFPLTSPSMGSRFPVSTLLSLVRKGEAGGLGTSVGSVQVSDDLWGLGGPRLRPVLVLPISPEGTLKWTSPGPSQHGPLRWPGPWFPMGGGWLLGGAGSVSSALEILQACSRVLSGGAPSCWLWGLCDLWFLGEGSASRMCCGLSLSTLRLQRAGRGLCLPQTCRRGRIVASGPLQRLGRVPGLLSSQSAVYTTESVYACVSARARSWSG